ncbi:hypothetical protein PFICI_05758 [Pestalotiopsis fici W106-1]|uniref:Uncharacterized protein n=1 Tax=Pestalotiopsis fici (strain W106-1 / CGMCC3.15140) TaxID=1229662 RepID=W3XEQ5_PESFW|nr:uncharacterized protein PFICI_05758 [Pestalotiopsis fici W106-1]ETS83882.1 hypothetical protein PFICI_05758 [Pestalotiopsis fici W106-1]
MHIPRAYILGNSHEPGSSYNQVTSHANPQQSDSNETWQLIQHELGRLLHAWTASILDSGSGLRKRTTAHQLDTTIGIVVGVLLGVFVLASIAFLYIYRGSIRIKKRKRHHRHRKSSGSRGSKASDSGASASAAAAPPAA